MSWHRAAPHPFTAVSAGAVTPALIVAASASPVSRRRNPPGLGSLPGPLALGRAAEPPSSNRGRCSGARPTIGRMMLSGLVRAGYAGLPGVSRRGAQWWWLGLPVVPVQGYRLARTLPRFADADGVTGRVGSGARRMKVVALGDSVTAGYAVEHHRSSVAGQLAARLADRYDAAVDWQACARTGATTGQALHLVSAEALFDADLVFVSIGVNDLKNLHGRRRFRRELAALLDAVLTAAPRAQVCLLGIPPLDHFPAFPRPLADALGWRGRVFDALGLPQSEGARGSSGSSRPNHLAQRCSPATDFIPARPFTPRSPTLSWRACQMPRSPMRACGRLVSHPVDHCLRPLAPKGRKCLSADLAESRPPARKPVALAMFPPADVRSGDAPARSAGGAVTQVCGPMWRDAGRGRWLPSR